MLRELHIENIAVIERADIEPGPGLNVLTGETGAGKSIVIDSLQAVLGSRVSRELVRTGAPKASVSAAFSSERAELWLRERDLESAGWYDAENPDDSGVLIRRRISAEGKSSAWINGENATAAELRELGALLLDIHGQNDGRALLDEANHRAYLDSFGELEGELATYREKYGAWRETKRELDRLDMNEREREFRLLELERTIQELEGARLSAGEEAARFLLTLSPAGIPAAVRKYSAGEELGRFLPLLRLALRDALFEKLGRGGLSLSGGSDLLRRAAARYPAEALVRALDRVTETEIDLKNNANAAMSLQALFVGILEGR